MHLWSKLHGQTEFKHLRNFEFNLPDEEKQNLIFICTHNRMTKKFPVQLNKLKCDLISKTVLS